ncbi:MAG: NAD(P)/FAD-dependent oxidoreductase [Acidobacteria bacterium]|nr:NAD(P)/FAD-dependent oxidoreductase [Acidobacteriota bacterium]
MNEQLRRADAVVTGGGLAGLAAATYLARAGKSVIVLEKSEDTGGRAATETRRGFHFNLGPHALYCRGRGAEVLGELGVTFSGGRPAPSGAYALSGGAAHTLPSGFMSLLSTGLLGVQSKLELARWLGGLSRLDTSELRHLTVSEWLAREFRQSESRLLIEALFRVSTYTNAPNLQSAGAAVDQFRMGLTGGVWYLDGGWATLVEGLRKSALEAGAHIITGSRAMSVIRETNHGGVSGVRLGDGSRIHSSAVVVAAGGPRDVRDLLEGAGGSLDLWAAGSVPVQAACLDLGLGALPRPHALFALGIDRPLYFSVHSASARLGPQGSALIHAAKYLAPGEEHDPQSARLELETALDTVQPGWRREVIVERFLPKMTVAHAVAAAPRGLAGRPGPAVPHIPGLFVAGDWVGDDGMLADAALWSARAAAQCVMGNTKRAAAA